MGVQLAKPLSASLPKTPASVASVANMMKPPPKVQFPLGLSSTMESKPSTLTELEKENPGGAGPGSCQGHACPVCGDYFSGGSDADPMQELQGSTSGTRGAAGRAKLQAELAQHRGLFFHAVVLAMARRMAPTSVADQPYGQLMAADITGTRHLERFGGYGRQRDLGLIQYQLMTIFDFMMADNVEAAKDCLSLLIVMVEQACIDQGRFDLGQVLTLQEDPPAGMFTNRQLSQVSRARSFAPLAEQRWITVALAFLKELDAISVKRTELLASPSTTTSGGDPSSPASKNRGRGNPKRKGRGGGRSSYLTEEEKE